LYIRRGDDRHNRKVIVEQYNDLTLDPNDTNYIGRVIGDQMYTLRYDTDGIPFLQLSGSFPNRSRYIRVEVFKENYNYPFTETSLSFTATSRAEVKFESEKTDPEIKVVGVDEHFLPNSGLETTLGRNFTGFDIDNNAYVCVVGSDFEKGLLKEVNPINKIISIRGAKFKVIGVLKEKGSTFGNSQDLRVLIPIQVARSLFTAPSINYSISTMVSKDQLLEEAIAKNKVEKKKIFIDLYTDWCGWCKKMDASTFLEPKLVEYMNKNYHCIKFNTEKEGPIKIADSICSPVIPLYINSLPLE
jgi:hypothetical protein